MRKIRNAVALTMSLLVMSCGAGSSGGGTGPNNDCRQYLLSYTIDPATKTCQVGDTVDVIITTEWPCGHLEEGDVLIFRATPASMGYFMAQQYLDETGVENQYYHTAKFVAQSPASGSFHIGGGANGTSWDVPFTVSK